MRARSGTALTSSKATTSRAISSTGGTTTGTVIENNSVIPLSGLLMEYGLPNGMYHYFILEIGINILACSSSLRGAMRTRHAARLQTRLLRESRVGHSF